MKTHIVITRVESGNENKYRQFMSLAKDGQVDGWTATSLFSPGDLVLFYFGAPNKAVVAVGLVKSKPCEADGPFDWTDRETVTFCDYSPVWPLDNPISLEKLAIDSGEDDWYLSKPYRSTREIPAKTALALLSQIIVVNPQLKAELEKEGLIISEREKSKTASSSQSTQKKSGSTKSGGAGFGESEKNAEVEAAAVSFVIQEYEANWWIVESVEQKKCGFDLVCCKNDKEEHVEVKGITGSLISFIITSGEVKQARNDPNFVVCVVTNALSTPKMYRYTAKQFFKKFVLEPMQYKATLKPN